MKPAQDRLAADLPHSSSPQPAVPVVCNVDATELTDGESSRDALVRQVTGSVKWEQIRAAVNCEGVQTFVEVGPGKVLWGLMRQIDRGKTSLNVGDESSLQKTVEHFRGVSV